MSSSSQKPVWHNFNDGENKRKPGGDRMYFPKGRPPIQRHHKSTITPQLLDPVAPLPSITCTHQPYLRSQACPICLPPIRTHNVPITDVIIRRKGRRPIPPPHDPSLNLCLSFHPHRAASVKEIVEEWPRTEKLYHEGLISRTTYFERSRIYHRWREMGDERFWQVYGGLSIGATLQRIREIDAMKAASPLDRLLYAISQEDRENNSCN